LLHTDFGVNAIEYLEKIGDIQMELDTIVVAEGV
jgi:hypothetical protein